MEDQYNCNETEELISNIKVEAENDLAAAAHIDEVGRDGEQQTDVKDESEYSNVSRKRIHGENGIEHSKSVSGGKIFSLRSSVEDKSLLLSNTWNELYNLLGEYKAELFSKEAFSQKYEGVSDVALLRNELLDKDNENQELRDQLEIIRQHNEQCLMDLSVKESLLKKYQEDLLQKESTILVSNTKISRLENRIRALETKVISSGGNASDGAPPRKMMRTQLSSGRMSSVAGGRMTPGGAGRTIVGAGARLGQVTGGRAVPVLTRRRLPLAGMNTQVLRPSMAATRTTPATKTPIVCIEVEDDDEIQAIAHATSMSHDTGDVSRGEDSMYVESWPEQDDGSSETDTTGLHSLPGSSMDQQPYPISASLTSAADMNQPLMMSDSHQAGFSGQDDSMTAIWPGEMGVAGDIVNLSHLQNQTPNKLLNLVCPQCGRRFTQKDNRDRHIRTVHVGNKNFKCICCHRRFTRRDNLRTHMIRCQHVNGNADCAICGMHFTKAIDLENHVTTRHRDTDYAV